MPSLTLCGLQNPCLPAVLPPAEEVSVAPCAPPATPLTHSRPPLEGKAEAESFFRPLSEHLLADCRPRSSSFLVGRPNKRTVLLAHFRIAASTESSGGCFSKTSLQRLRLGTRLQTLCANPGLRSCAPLKGKRVCSVCVVVEVGKPLGRAAEW